MPANSYVLLLRGINVNPSTRISMADLRDVVAGLGYQDVRTLLQSGNVIVESSSEPNGPALSAAILAKTGVTSPVVVLAASEFRALVDANPLLEAGDDLSKMVITFVDGKLVPGDIERPTDAELAPECLVITPRAIYQWCPNGILQSKLKPGWWRKLGAVPTSRNVRTANKILDAL